MDITVVIPCRAGSTRVKDKNFKSFSNKGLSLLEIKIIQALKLNLPVVVNSDSDTAKALSIKYNIEFVRRPEYYASSKCSNSEYYEYLANSVNSEYLMILQPTSPLLTDETLFNCYDTYKKNIDTVDSLITVTYSKKHAWYQNKPINYDIHNAPNSQDLIPVMFPTFNVMCCKTSDLKTSRYVISDNCFFYEISEEESIEIDNQLEFDIAQFLYNKKYYDQ